MLASALTGEEDSPLEDAELPLAVLTRILDPADAADPRSLLAHLAHQYRLLTERAMFAWQTYRDAAATDPDVAADWQRLNQLRRQGFHALFAHFPAGALRPGLTHEAAADTAWVIASLDTHDQLVRQAGYSYDQLEDWVRTVLSAALFPAAEDLSQNVTRTAREIKSSPKS